MYEGKYYIDDKGVVRWKSNDRVPPQDCLEQIYKSGAISEVKYELSQIIRDEETSAFLADYRKRMENYEPSPEELFEMRATFGEGAVVVNAITGKKINL